MTKEMGDEAMRHTAGLTGLKTLRIGGRVTEAGLVHIVKMTKLETLTLNGHITAAGLVHLRPLVNLRRVTVIGGGNFADWKEGLGHLAQLPNLEYLYLDDIEYTSELGNMFKDVELEFWE